MREYYENPLCTRYAGDTMKKIFSADTKFSTWRKLWIALAESEKELGIDITDEQIAQMKEHIYDIDYDKAKKYESELRHDVMAHVHTYGDVCPEYRYYCYERSSCSGKAYACNSNICFRRFCRKA